MRKKRGGILSCWIVFSVTALGNFISMLNASAVNLALYQMSKTFDITIAKVQWVVLSYMIVLSGLLIFFGRLGDLINRKKLYAVGFCFFAIGSFLAFMAPTFPFLIVARVVQAVGGSILTANSFAVVSTVFNGSSRGKALAFLGAFTHLAAIIAPALSGFLMQFFSWKAIFVPCVFLSFVGMLSALKFIPSSAPSARKTIDIAGTFLLLISLTSFLLLPAQASTWTWNSVETAMCATVCLIFFILFGLREKITRFPLIRFSLFQNATFLYGNMSLLLSYLAIYANVFIFPLYLQEVLKLTPFVTGLLIFPYSTGYFLMAVSTGTFDAFKRMHIGLAVMVLCLLAFAFTDTQTPLWFLGILQLVMGASNALYQPSVNLAILNASPAEDIGMSSGILSLARNVGIALGGVSSVLFFNIFKKSALASGLTHTESFSAGYDGGLYVGALFGMICLFLTFCTERKKT